MRPSRRVPLSTWLTIGGIAVVVAQWIQQVVAGQRNGVLALGQIFAPHLLLVVTMLIGAMALRRASGRAVRVALVVALVIGAVRYGPGMVSLPATAPSGSTPVEVMSWNLEATGSGVPGVLEVLRQTTAGVIGLQEFDRANDARLRADAGLAARYPSQISRPRDGSTGIALLSVFPILASGWLEDPSAIWARLDLGEGRTLLAVTAHPLPADIGWWSGAFDASTRDASIRALRAFVDGLRIGDEPLVLFGDFNVTDREPAYGDLSLGLHDAHADVGLGTGSTWRLAMIERLPFGILRIDHVFTGGRAVPLAIGTDCTPRGSDHCIVSATIAVGP